MLGIHKSVLIWLDQKYQHSLVLEGGSQRKGGLFGLLKSDSKEPPSDGMVSSHQSVQLRAELDLLHRALQVLKGGTLLMDEVDLLLHPLRSELHWPLGLKLPLDFVQVSCFNYPLLVER